MKKYFIFAVISLVFTATFPGDPSVQSPPTSSDSLINSYSGNANSMFPTFYNPYAYPFVYEDSRARSSAEMAMRAQAMSRVNMAVAMDAVLARMAMQSLYSQKSSSYSSMGYSNF
ncbi:hypothetical protein GVAV_001744 [Gurleya vavrai]